MKTIGKKLTKIAKGYLKDLQKKPIATGIKTVILIWVVSYIIKMLKK